MSYWADMDNDRITIIDDYWYMEYVINQMMLGLHCGDVECDNCKNDKFCNFIKKDSD